MTDLFFCFASFVRAAAAAFEALVASLRRSAAVIDCARAKPPSLAISRTSITGTLPPCLLGCKRKTLYT